MFGSSNKSDVGIANLVIKDLFLQAVDSKSTVSVSFLEIYNEQVKDLLSDSVPKDFGEKSKNL